MCYAAGRGRTSTVRLLYREGSEIDSEDDAGQTPLSNAAKFGHTAVVRLLLELGAKKETKDQQSKTPLWYATASHSIAAAELYYDKEPISNLQMPPAIHH
jgi:ankyrin repeat protein